MDSNNKNLRDKLNEPPAHLPKELDWANMKDGVFAKMTKSGSNVNGSNRRYLYVISLIIFILTIPFCYKQYTGIRVDQPLTTTDSSIGVHNNSDQSDKKDINSTLEVSAQTQKPTNELINNFQSHSISDLPTVNNKNKINPTIDIKNPSMSNSIPFAIASDSQNEIQRMEDRTSDDVFEAIEGVPYQLTLPRLSETNYLATLPINLDILSNTEGLNISIPSLRRPGPASFHQVFISSGISFWDFGYGSNLPDRAPFESSIISFSSQIHYRCHFRNKLFIISGLNLHLLQSQFDWSTTIEDHTVTLENVVLEKRTDALTGEVGQTIGDVEVEVEAERHVRHFNSISLLQVPLGIGKSHRFGVFALSYQVGASFNILDRSDGRVLYQGDVIDLTGSDNDVFNSDWAVNGFFGVNVSYSLGRSWSMGLGLNYQKSLSNWSLEEDVKMRPQIINVSLGFSYLW